MIDSLRRLLALEPDEVMAESEVRRSVEQLAGLLIDHHSVGREIPRPAEQA